jgi:hypothetical protein
MTRTRKTATEAPQPEAQEVINQVAQATELPREPGDDSQSEQQTQKAGWQPWNSISIPLDEAAKRDHTKGEVARYTEGYNAGVGMRIDSSDPNFIPSAQVNEPVKENHEGRQTPRWKNKFGKKLWHKETKHNPVAERLDAEGRFEEMAKRRKEEKQTDSKSRS